MKRNAIRLQHSFLPDVGIGVFITAVIAFTYRGLFNTFFQQDEWVGYGDILSWGSHWLTKSYSIIDSLAGKGRILGVPVNYLLFTIRPFDVTYFSIFSIAVHSVNSILVYAVTKNIWKSRIPAFICAVIFSLSYSAHEAVSWFAAGTTTLPSMTFILLSLLLIQKFIKSGRYMFLYTAQIVLICSYLFKESGLFILLALPIIVYLLRERKYPAIYWYHYGISVMYASLLVVYRLFSFFSGSEQGPVFITQHSSPFAGLIFHATVYPVLAVSQLILPYSLVGKIALKIGETQYPFLSSNTMQNGISSIIIGDMTSLFFSGVILLLFIFLYRVHALRRMILFVGLYHVICFLPFAVLDRPMSSYLSSRYYYAGAFGAGLFFSLIFESIVRFSGRLKMVRSLSLVVFLVFFSVISYKYSVYIQRDIRYNEIIAEDRMSFLHQLRVLRPDLPENPIIYISGDSPGFYGLADLAIPFPQGMGYTLMVWYHDTGAVPDELLRQYDFWNLYSQGYKKSGTKGFGYYWRKDDLIHDFKVQRSLSTNQIVAFRYTGSTKKLTDISEDIRNEIITLRTRE